MVERNSKKVYIYRGIYRQLEERLIYMKKDDLSVTALLLEAIVIILGVAYIGLQIYYGIYYHVPIYKYVINIFLMVLLYLGLTILSNYPERINHIPQELCVGAVRKYSLWLVRLVKFIFVCGLLIPSLCDAFGIAIQSAYSLIIIGLFIIVSVFCEWKIITELKNNNK